MSDTRREPEDVARAGAEVDRLLETASRAAAARESRASMGSLPSMSAGRRSVLDPVEALHREAGHWGELCELYLQRLDVATDDAERAKLLRRIGTILCEQLDDPQQALEAFTEALIHEPEDEGTAIALEAIANALSAWETVVRSVAARLDDDAGGPRDVALSGLLVRWIKRYLERPADAEPYLARIKEIDPTHSAVHARQASVYRERGSFREQQAELETALLSARTSEERRLLHLALAELTEERLKDRAAAIRHLEAALAIDPKGAEALAGLERLFRLEERHADVQAILEKTIDAAGDDESRVAALMRLAEMHEQVFLKPERAAVNLERAVALAPNHAPAFAALERCYRASRSWSELARILEVQTRTAGSRSAQLAKLLEVAEVFEAKLGDEGAALATYKRIAELDARSSDAWLAVVRLSERAGDWRGVVTARKRLSELATTPEAKARLHVAIGETLAAHDPKQAEGWFERASAIDPTCAAAWDALIARAREAGAMDRVAELLEQRVAHTDSPRMRGERLVELADARAALGDFLSAEAAEEDAVAVDPGNEIAGARVLPRYVASERWLDALPLCERLVNAAVRDGDDDRACAHRRTMTRIALGLDDLARAMTAALSAYEARPTPLTAEDVVDVCHRARGDAALVTRARSALDAITGARDHLTPACLAKLGEVASSFGSGSAARALFRQALGGDPCCTPALSGITALADDPATSAEAAEMTIRAAAHAATKEERFRLLIKAGELFAYGANDLGMAAASYEEARTVVPRDHRVLHTLVWIYCEIGEWSFLADILRSIADSEAEPVKRAKGIYAMALVLRDKVGDVTRAAAAFEQVLDLDPSRLEAFERLVRVHTERRDWPRLAKSYEKMILRTSSEAERDRKHALYFQLALVQRDWVGDVAMALQALRSAAQLKPEDATTRKALIELLVIAGQLEDAMEVARAAIALRPDDPAPYAEMYDVAMRLRSYDRGWRAVDALKAAGGAVDPVQEQFHREFGATPLVTATTPIVPPEWKRLFHPKIDPHLTGILAYATRAVLRSPRVRATREQAGRALGAPLKPTADDAARVIGAVRRGAELLGVGVPALHACKTSAPFEVLPSAPALLVSLEPCRALGESSLAFLVGKHLAAAEPELLAAIVFPTLPELDALVGAALRAIEPARAADETPGPFDRLVREAMTKDEAERVRSLAASARARGGRFDVALWKRHADASAARVGLLLAGSLEGARRALVASPLAAGAMPAREQMQELTVLSVGELLGGLRASLGVAVRG